MPYIAGMSLGSWILIIAIAIWTFIAIKCYFFGGFKKHGEGSRPHVGSCCGGGDQAYVQSACASCAKRNGCHSAATDKNAVAPIIKEVK